MEDRLIDGPKIPLSELFSLVRHSKFSLLKDALDYLPTKPFDKSLIQVIPSFLKFFLFNLSVFSRPSMQRTMALSIYLAMNDCLSI